MPPLRTPSIPPNLERAQDYLRDYLKTSGFTMERVRIIAGQGRVPNTQSAARAGAVGQEIYAAAVIYNTALGAPRAEESIPIAFAVVLTTSGVFCSGFPRGVLSRACRDAAGETMSRHEVFEWIDRQWYITKTGWKRTPNENRGFKFARHNMLVNGGGRGTMLVPVTILDDHEPGPILENRSNQRA